MARKKKKPPASDAEPSKGAAAAPAAPTPPLPKVTPPDPLCPRRELFCQEYIVDLNAKRAYQRVYECDDATAETNGPRLLRIAQVKKRVDELLEERAERTMITADYVLATIRDTVQRCRQARPVLDMWGKQVFIPDPQGGPLLVPAYTFQPKEVLKGCELLLRHVVTQHAPGDLAASGATPAPAAKRSFEEFCKKAGYPAPYAKQVEMKDFVLRGGEEKLQKPRLLLGTRGCGKSMYSTMAGVAYEIYLDQTFTVLLTTKVQTNGRKMLREISRCLKANGVELEVDNADEIRTKGLIGNNPSVTMVPLGSSGFRSLHPRLAIMDDPVVPGKVSEADRDQVKTVYAEILKLTKNVAIIGQPVDFRDLYAHLRKIIKTMEVPHGSIPELDEDLDVLRASGVDEKSIQASYFLKVDPEGDATFHDIQLIDAFPEQDSIAFIDPSDGGKSHTALGIFTNHFTGMAIVGFSWKKAWHLCIPEIKAACKRFRVHKLGFEVNKHGVLPLQVLRENLHDINVIVEGKYTHSDKDIRIGLAAQFSKNLYLSKQSDAEYTRQVIEYSHDAKLKDAPDTIATFMEWAGKIRPPKAVKEPSKDL
jgi:hypothetical protein